MAAVLRESERLERHQLSLSQASYLFICLESGGGKQPYDSLVAQSVNRKEHHLELQEPEIRIRGRSLKE